MRGGRSGVWAATAAVACIAWSTARAEPSTSASQPAELHSASTLVQQVWRDTQWLAGYDSRVVGTAGHDSAVAGLVARIERLKDRPGVRIWRHSFEMVVPRTTRAELRIDSGPAKGIHPVYPLWPGTVRPNTTPKEGITGRLVYIGTGTHAELRPKTLRGQIAVMEMTGGNNWERAWSHGARAVVLLGSPDESRRDAHSHLTRLPLNVPRFYVPEGPLADTLRQAGSPDEPAVSGRLFSAAEFAPVTATNIYALVKPEKPGKPRPALALAAPIDSMSIVPDRAPGADNAVDASLLLNLLEHCAEDRPVRPVLFSFVDGCAINMLGVRQMLVALSAGPRDWANHLKEDQAYERDYARLRAMVDELLAGGQALDHLCQSRYSELHRCVKDEVAREVVAIETELHPLRLKLFARNVPGPELSDLRQREKELADRRTKFYAAQHRLLSGKETEGSGELVEALWRRVCQRVAGQHDEVKARLTQYAERTGVRSELAEELGLDGATQRPIGFLLALDISDGGPVVGPRFFCAHLKLNETGNAKDFARWLRMIERKEAASVWPAGLLPAVDFGPLSGTVAVESHSVGTAANLSGPASSFGTAAATWGTLDALRERIDTPQDRPDRLDWSRLAPQLDATICLVRRMVRHTDFEQTSKLQPRWTRVSAVIVDQSPGEPVPRIPMSGYLGTLVNGYARGGQMFFYSRTTAEGVRNDEFRFTGTDGMLFFDAIPAGNATSDRSSYFKNAVQAYQLAADGQIVRAIDLNKVGRGVRLDVDFGEPAASPRRGVVFTCRETNLVGLFDPRFLLNLPFGTVLDAQRVGRPQRLNFALYQGQMSCLLEPGIRWELLLRTGSTEIRMALLNVVKVEPERGPASRPDEPGEQTGELALRQAAKGFEPGQMLPATPLEIAAADLDRLDTRRLANYRRAGITSKAVDELHRRTSGLRRQAEQAFDRDDGLGLFKAASGAVSNEVRAYQAVRELANDVIRAAIFLLLVLVPFSYAMERLLFASPHVYRQIAGVLAIFAVMTGVLWSFHPAFRISNQPLMIIMAFAIIAMSVLVMSIVYQKFKSQLEEMRSGRAESSGARTSRVGLAVSAIRLGIANMRKRKLRTALTGATVVLITFALLCFTSVSSYVGHQERALGVRSPYTGLLIRQPQLRSMPPEALVTIGAAMDQAERVVPQYWWCSPLSPQWRIHVRDAARTTVGFRLDFGQTFDEWLWAMLGGSGVSQREIMLNAALGLAPGEEHLTGIHRVLPDWPRFAAEGGCYLSVEAADQLGVKPGDVVIVAGRELRLVGTFDPVELQQVRTMTGETILPTDYSALGEEQRLLLASQDQDQLIAELASGTALEADVHLPTLSGSAVVILPADMVASLPGGSLRSIAIQTRTAEEARLAALEMANRVAFPIYFGSPDSVRVIAAMPLTPKAPKSLAIMLVIAGLIIFNTMLNSIAERRKEVHIYSSLGLAPMHIGMLFLAEAATYGLMGSIFGYIVGQGIATALGHLGWLGGVTLNYSGTQAVATMVMVLAVTVLSSLVPAYMAGKLAAPAEHMKWSVPRPIDDRIRDSLPFTVTDKTANGVVMFLHDYLDAHREGSIGHFSTDNLRLVRLQVDGQELLGVESTVWLAPYDLGVRQMVRLTIGPTGDTDVLQIDVELTREAGQVSSWWKLNRVFLGDLRKQLLGWRKLKTSRVLEYIAAGARVLAD